MLAHLLRDGPDDEEEDAILSVALVSRPTSVQSGKLLSNLVDGDLVEVCKHAAVQLNIAGPVTPGGPGVKCDTYDRKRLPFCLSQVK